MPSSLQTVKRAGADNPGMHSVHSFFVTVIAVLRATVEIGNGVWFQMQEPEIGTVGLAHRVSRELVLQWPNLDHARSLLVALQSFGGQPP